MQENIFMNRNYYFFFNLTSHIPDVSILSVWEEKLFFFFFICFSTSTIIWIPGESWYLKLLNGKTTVVYIFSSRYKISVEEGEDLRTFWTCKSFKNQGWKRTVLVSHSLCSFLFSDSQLKLPVGLISWLFCQMLGSSTHTCVYTNNCFLITCQEAIIFHCGPPGIQLEWFSTAWHVYGA